LKHQYDNQGCPVWRTSSQDSDADKGLPELATSIAATRKDEGDIVIGNVIGSNVLTILFVLGLAALIAPLHTNDLRLTDLVVLVSSAILIFPLMRCGFQLTRREGAFLLAGYLGYLYSLMP
jgi:cation:H+ antiporter